MRISGNDHTIVLKYFDTKWIVESEIAIITIALDYDKCLIIYEIFAINFRARLLGTVTIERNAERFDRHGAFRDSRLAMIHDLLESDVCIIHRDAVDVVVPTSQSSNNRIIFELFK